MNAFPPLLHCGVKICGLTSAAQAVAVSELGADALGLNFWPRSKRYVSVQTVAGWDLSAVKAALVAVTVNATLDELRAIREQTPVQMLQLHGDEGPAEVERALGLGLPVIKALQIQDAASLAAIRDFPCQTLLLDSYNPGSYGGEGRQFPWELMLRAKEMFPERSFILAGGLTPENVALAVAGARPAAVDVASGVESGPGVKDMDKTRLFLSSAKSVA